jgi:hypothetical protein
VRCQPSNPTRTASSCDSEARKRALVLSTTSFANDDLPEAGIPEIPTRKRSFGGVLLGQPGKYDSLSVDNKPRTVAKSR